MAKPRLTRATLGQFITAFLESDSEKRTSSEKVVVFTWGPFLVVAPGERRAWKSDGGS